MKLRKLTAILFTMVLCLSLLAINVFADTNEALGAPVLSGSYDQATGTITLTWTPVEGAATYMVYGSLYEEKDVNLQDLGETAETSFTYTEVTAGSTYHFVVKALDAEGNVSPALSNAVDIECTIPDPEPQPLTAPVVTATNVASTGKVKLTWAAVEGAVKYEVYRSTKENSGFTLLKTASGTSFTNTSTVIGTTYYYKVKAVAEDSALNSGYSSVVSRTCALPRPTVTASNVAKTGKVKLTWAAIEGAVKYEIYRAESKDGEYKLMYTAKGTSYTNTSAKSTQTYYYKVKAIHSISEASSAYSAIKTRTADLPRPVVSVESQSTSHVRIMWPAVEGATSYKVYRSDSKNGTYKLLKTTTYTSFKNTSVEAGHTYYYKVKAYCGVSAATSAYSSVISGKTVPVAPVMKITASSTSSSIKVSWEKVSGASGYYVYRRYHSSSKWKLVKTITSGNTTSYNNKDISGRYYWKVAAYVTADGKKHSGPYSEEIAARTISRRFPTVSNNRFTFQNTLTWSHMKAPSRYEIYYRISSTGEWQLADVIENVAEAETMTYVHDVQHGKYYYYRIRGVYEENGVTTYGEYGPTSFKQIISYRPDLTISMSKKTVKSASRTTIGVTNNGPCGIRFYAEDAMWLDPDKTSNCRDAVLYDYEVYKTTGELVKVDSVWLSAGKTTTLLIGVKGSNTRYDSDTAIYLLCYSDGLKYEAYISADSGCMIYKK